MDKQAEIFGNGDGEALPEINEEVSTEIKEAPQKTLSLIKPTMLSNFNMCEHSHDNKSDLVRFVEMTKDLDVDKLEKFIALRTQDEERNARRDFDLHFAEMQKDYKAVIKDKEVKNKEKTKVLYKFCPLENILNVYAPIIAAHGFSFRWSEDAIEKGKRVWCIVSGYGHVEKTSVDMPINGGNDFTSNLQQQGISTSYGKRYSFNNAFGVIIEGEDSDGQTSSDPDTLKMDLLEYCDKKAANGAPILLPGAIDMIKAECAKPSDQRDTQKMRDWYKRAKAKVDGK